MNNPLELVVTALKLGLGNIARVAIYKTLLRIGRHPVQGVNPVEAEGDFFFLAASPVDSVGGIHNNVRLRLFGWLDISNDGAAPNWHQNPVAPERRINSDVSWWNIPDFCETVGDIKYIWELSRFDWVINLAQLAKQGDSRAISQLNIWLDDWEKSNPPFFGANWKCGQEASIRVMHLAMALLILGQLSSIRDRVAALILNHLRRIRPTLSYAAAQSNNHATSEAAALYIGGHILQFNGHCAGRVYAQKGRQKLHDYVLRLFCEDGSFAQHSANYHRVALDTLSLVEIFRSQFGDREFSSAYLERAKSATRWLASMIMSLEGDGPNLGHNDGANLLAFPNIQYFDRRLSVQLASALFVKQRAFDDSELNKILHLLDVEVPMDRADAYGPQHYEDGGLVTFIVDQASVLFRYPKFKFRPSQSDALHVDLWVNGLNLLRDGGTYSYNAGGEVTTYFGGVASHNTVQFDDRDQMPRLSRFLFGSWLKPVAVEVDLHGEVQSAAAAYCDKWGACHHRKIQLDKGQLTVEDELAGNFSKAVLRWRLPKGEWVRSGNMIAMDRFKIIIEADAPFDLKLITGKESRFYGHIADICVLEVQCSDPISIKSEILF